MSFAYKGGVAAIFAVITIGVCVVALLPKVFWTEAKVSIEGTNMTLKVQSSLWRQCNTTNFGGASLTSCSDIRKIDFKNIKSEPSAEQDGAIAGLVLGGLFALFSFLGVCCQHKCATASLLVISLIFTAATVGCYYRYKDNSLSDEFDFTTGYWLACAACGFALISVLGSCCMSKDRSHYEILA